VLLFFPLIFLLSPGRLVFWLTTREQVPVLRAAVLSSSYYVSGLLAVLSMLKTVWQA
jgi:hypothetical protein